VNATLRRPAKEDAMTTTTDNTTSSRPRRPSAAALFIATAGIVAFASSATANAQPYENQGTLNQVGACVRHGNTVARCCAEFGLTQ
jgi:hypothetical protein